MKSMVELSHEFLEPCLHSQAICIDATLGQGKDAKFFLEKGVKKVYGFEIQEEVLKETTEKIQNTRLQAFLLGHERMSEVIHESVDAIVFNFGYFPNGNHEIVTQQATSVSAISQALSLLKIKGRMCLVMYPHESGRQEAEGIEEYLKHIDNCQIHKLTNFIQDDCPYLIMVEKRR